MNRILACKVEDQAKSLHWLSNFYFLSQKIELIIFALISMPPRALDERSDLQDWVAQLPGAEPPWDPSGLSHGAGRGGQAADVGQALRQPWQCTGWGQPGAGRRCLMGLQVMSFGWLKSCISQLAWTCTRSLRNHLVLLRGTASRAQPFIWLCSVEVEHCPASTWILPLCWAAGAWPLSLPMACDSWSQPHYSFP